MRKDEKRHPELDHLPSMKWPLLFIGAIVMVAIVFILVMRQLGDRQRSELEQRTMYADAGPTGLA